MSRFGFHKAYTDERQAKGPPWLNRDWTDAERLKRLIDLTKIMTYAHGDHPYLKRELEWHRRMLMYAKKERVT